MKKSIYTVVVLALLPWPALAALEVAFEFDPLFTAADFMPGDSVTRSVSFHNPDSDSYQLAIKAVNMSDPDGLGERIDFTVMGQASAIVYFNGTLAGFNAAGTVSLSTLGPGEAEAFDLSAVFQPGTGNAYQEKSLSFDIAAGSDGPESVTMATAGGGHIFLASADQPAAAAPVAVKGLSAAFPEAGDSPVLPEEHPIVLGINNILDSLSATGFAPGELALLLGVLVAVMGARALAKRRLKG